MLLAIHPKDPEPRKIADVVQRLNNGAVVVCPTDTVYAFVCSAHQPRAIEAIARLKGTKAHKTDLSLICKDLSQLSTYARAIDTPGFRLMKKALPGPYTFIVPASSEIPRLFKNNKRTVGIRVPDHPIPLAIVESLGHALVVTSVHDDDILLEHTTDPELIEERIGKQVELVIDGGICGMEGSTVIDLTGAEPEVLREGKGPVAEIF
ncbi:MAG: threonylcarbamoyl-AMP synthase [Flavobacteriales bacterium]|jgi:tRNA threonylcarbamoyl adenosine modification protein (Sua5/YciO/YrdC/YwlC family)|nr:threonylcarbamoyl-AMP synthase [Flavobacteriales bacterium]MBK6894522.1 threonylcarbamoyl-AMP synthase [Flavobacteriales bacterium]MBK7248453.1 threonylcarbamoyl-AMP synthase [Flavobacteriales bacterium]MBK9059328.1 threonylcarbamoyl-AMP synthase [Flavobacteriales bacterium]MBK9597731.1 threonylcarbamoyl-AMP synthase [Flavobacteriales bacterium]